MVRSGEVTGYAVLRDYPLRLWALQEQHTEELLREFNLLLLGLVSGQASHVVPAQLVALAAMFTNDFGTLLDELSQVRRAAYDGGADRMDSTVPLVPDTEALLEGARRVIVAVDEFCARGDLLALSRPPELRALSDWTFDELIRQHQGAAPNAWPGPF